MRRPRDHRKRSFAARCLNSTMLACLLEARDSIGPLKLWPDGQRIMALSSGPSLEFMMNLHLTSAGSPHVTAPSESIYARHSKNIIRLSTLDFSLRFCCLLPEIPMGSKGRLLPLSKAAAIRASPPRWRQLRTASAPVLTSISPPSKRLPPAEAEVFGSPVIPFTFVLVNAVLPISNHMISEYYADAAAGSDSLSSPATTQQMFKNVPSMPPPCRLHRLRSAWSLIVSCSTFDTA